jgi:hypothetical protein
MKKIIWALLLGVSLNTGQAQEIEPADIQMEKSPLKQSTEPLEGNPREFADLAKATMNLMRPELETAQTNDQESNNLAIQAN